MHLISWIGFFYFHFRSRFIKITIWTSTVIDIHVAVLIWRMFWWISKGWWQSRIPRIFLIHFTHLLSFPYDCFVRSIKFIIGPSIVRVFFYHFYFLWLLTNCRLKRWKFSCWWLSCSEIITFHLNFVFYQWASFIEIYVGEILSNLLLIYWI